MNKERRKRISKYLEELEFIQSEVQSIKDEEQDAYDNLPESIQLSDRGCQIEAYADALDEAYYNLQEAIDTLFDIAEG